MIKINCPTCLRPTYAIYENAGILNYIEDLPIAWIKEEDFLFNKNYFCHHCKNRIVNPYDCEWEDIGLCDQCGKELNEENRSGNYQVSLTDEGEEYHKEERCKICWYTPPKYPKEVLKPDLEYYDLSEIEFQKLKQDFDESEKKEEFKKVNQNYFLYLEDLKKWEWYKRALKWYETEKDDYDEMIEERMVSKKCNKLQNKEVGNVYLLII